jgi:hypothetical protein
MTDRWRNIIFVAFAILLTLLASFGEVLVIAAGITIGDMTGSPPGLTEAGKQTILALQHRADRGLWLAIGALIPACLLLGSVLARRFEEMLPSTGRVFGYFLGLVLCPAASVVVVVLAAWIGHSPF